MTQTEPQTEPQTRQIDEDASKDAFFARIAELSEQMIHTHGKDFAMGTLVLAARWIASDKISGAPPRH